MKQIFDWLREQFDKQSINGISENGLVVTSFIHSKIAKLCIDEAEAKWEADCCEWKRGNDYKEMIFAPHKSIFAIHECSLEDTPYCPFCGKPIKISEVE